MSYTSTEYTPVLRGPLEEGQKDMLTGESNDLQTTLWYVTPVSVSVRYTKHPLAIVPVLKRHTSPLGEEVTAPQHLVCRAVQSLHINHLQMSIIEVSICRRLHMDTSMILICRWLICRLCTALHTKCCGAVGVNRKNQQHQMYLPGKN